MLKTDTARLRIISSIVLVGGLLTLWTTLLSIVRQHNVRVVLIDAHFNVIAGISLIYLASVIRRAKYNAWLIAVIIYAYLLIRNLVHALVNHNYQHFYMAAFLNFVLILAGSILLIKNRKLFKVRSEPQTFKIAFIRSLILLTAALLYGVAGFQYLDKSDFHQEITIPSSIHNTIDQFGLTTTKDVTAYTERSRVFVDSLAAISILSVVYASVSFFAPIRFRLSNHVDKKSRAYEIAKISSRTSEDYFKFWPEDKEYFFSDSGNSFIAYRVCKNVALVVGDPCGANSEFNKLICGFSEYARLNDWSLAFIHASKELLSEYQKNDFSVQKIGEEAIVNVNNFVDMTLKNKYFRHINNKFSKLGFTTEILYPPHSKYILDQLDTISNEWAAVPGRSERGFMLGYYNHAYLDQCPIFITKNQDGEIMAFLNQLPFEVESEANYDFLRHKTDTPGNIGDYLMLNFISHLKQQDMKYLNMGLCPLSGLDKIDKRGAIDGILNFIYTNAGRFYSFKGLRRFKEKYEPQWCDRYIIYSGGIPGFSKTGNALLSAMKDLK